MMPEDMPTVQSMEAVDLHLRMIVKELRDIKTNQDGMVAMLRKEMDARYAALEAKISENSPRSFLRRVTEIAVAVVSVCTAVGFLIAVFRFLKL